MSDLDLFFLLFACVAATTIGYIGHKNGVEYRNRLEEDKRRAAVDRIWNRLDRLREDNPPGEVYRPFFDNSLEEVSREYDRGHLDWAKVRLLELIEAHKQCGKYIRASHPPQLRLKFPLIEAEIPTVEVKSRNANSRTVYNVNVCGRTCSCDASEEVPEDIPRDDARWVCRHQIEVLERFGAMPELDPQTAAVVSNPFREPFYTELHDDEIHMVVGYSVPILWVRIWVLKPEKQAGTYSLNVKENRWAYGESPTGIANKVKALMRKGFGVV